MWRSTAFFTLALLTACAGVPADRTVSVPGLPSRSVMIELYSQIEYRPYSPEELANPAMQAVIAQCERQGGKHCREKEMPGNPLKKFARNEEFVKWVAENLPKSTYVNIMHQYHVAYKAFEFQEIWRSITAEEYLEAMKWAEEQGLTNLDPKSAAVRDFFAKHDKN